jgi:DNA-binding PadR family transcriptional regulator
MSASKEEIREAMKILWDIDAEDVDKALDSLVKDGLVEVDVEEQQPT